jgi:hypothetical protein
VGPVGGTHNLDTAFGGLLGTHTLRQLQEYMVSGFVLALYVDTNWTATMP